MRESEPLPGPGRVAQLGYLRRILADPTPVLDELSAAHGPMVGLGFGPARMAIVGDPEAVNELFRMPDSRFRWNHKFNVLGFVVGKSSLIVSDGEAHRLRRKAVTPGFARRRLNGWIPMITEETDAAIDRVVDAAKVVSGPIDLYPVGRDLVLRIVVRAMFGESMVARTSEIGALFQRPQAYLESPAVKQLPHRLPFTTRARVRADRRALDSIIDDAISERRTNPDAATADVLSALVDAGDLTDTEIRDQVVSLIGAGYDTTSASLAWMLWCCTSAPGLWQGLRREAEGAFGFASELDHELLGRLPLADRVMRETLRLHPAGVVGPREAAEDFDLGGYKIKEGTLILWSAYLVGRDPTIWPRPLEFDPTRFDTIDPDQRAANDRVWVPFGGGSRNCIGFALAQMELTIIIARLAQRLDLTPTSTTMPRPYGMVVNRPIGGVPMQVRPVDP